MEARVFWFPLKREHFRRSATFYTSINRLADDRMYAALKLLSSTHSEERCIIGKNLAMLKMDTKVEQADRDTE